MSQQKMSRKRRTLSDIKWMIYKNCAICNYYTKQSSLRICRRCYNYVCDGCHKECCLCNELVCKQCSYPDRELLNFKTICNNHFDDVFMGFTNKCNAIADLLFEKTLTKEIGIVEIIMSYVAKKTCFDIYYK